MSTHSEFEPSGGSRWNPQSILDALDWEHARGEVAQENRARVAIAGLRGAGKSTLLNRLEGWDVSPVGSPAATSPSEVRPERCAWSRHAKSITPPPATPKRLPLSPHPPSSTSGGKREPTASFLQ